MGSTIFNTLFAYFFIICNLYFNVINGQTNNDPEFFEGYWVDFDELQKLENDRFGKSFPFNNSLLFFETKIIDGKYYVRNEFDYDYRYYDLIALKKEWKTQPCIFNIKNCDGSIKFNVINKDTIAIINYPLDNYPLRGIKVFSRINSCKNIESFDVWVYVPKFITGKYVVKTVKDVKKFMVEFKEDMTVIGFKSYNRYRVNLKNSELIIVLYNELNPMESEKYFIVKNGKSRFLEFKDFNGISLYEIIDLEQFKSSNKAERVITPGKLLWKLFRVD